MNSNRNKSFCPLWLIFLGLMHNPMAPAAGMPTIQNESLRVRYDASAGTFEATQRRTGKEFLTHGRLEGAAGSGRLERVRDPIFGAGRSIRVERADGGFVSLELYPGLPFLLIRGELRNTNSTTTDFKDITPAGFALDLGARAEDVRTLGTAGLTAPDKNPGSYLFLTLAEPVTRRGVVAGWLTNDRGSGVLFSEVQAGRVWFKAQLDFGRLRLDPRQSASIETLAVGFFDDARVGEECYADALARQYDIHLKTPMPGYCTWYSNPHGGAADEVSITELADFAGKELKPFGFSFVQIDDQWQDGKERNGPARRFLRARPQGPYPNGMQLVADHLRQLGLTAGIWFLPFASDYQDPEFKDRQDWFVKRSDGTPFETPWGNTSLDLTRPEVQSYLSEMVRTIHGWGYNYFKMDGLWTGAATEQIYVNDGYRDDHFGSNAPFYNPRKTNLEVFRAGLKLLRQAAGPDVFFSGCNVSQNMRTLGGSIGLVDSMRIGPDNGQRWSDYRREIARNGSGSIITGPVRGTRLYFLNGRVWWNDPDPTYVRSSVPLSEATLITSWVALSGQFYLNSDWLPGLPPERLEIIRRTIPAHGATARPVDYFETEMPRIWLVTDTRQTPRRDVLGLFNWESEDRDIGCTVAKAGLAASRHYFAFDFWANAPVQSFSDQFQYRVPARSCRVLAVRPTVGHPVLVSTSRHVSQGMLEVTAESWKGRTLSATSRLVANDPYELRVAGLAERGQNWKLESLRVSAADHAAGVRIEPKSPVAREAGWLRVVINSPTDRSVDWSLRFSK